MQTSLLWVTTNNLQKTSVCLSVKTTQYAFKYILEYSFQIKLGQRNSMTPFCDSPLIYAVNAKDNLHVANWDQNTAR